MATIYRKTEKGQSEVSTRQHNLTLKLRSALIMVDGRRTDEDLLRMIPGNAMELLQGLLADGFIETAGVTGARAPVAAAAERQAQAAAEAPATADTIPVMPEPAGPALAALRSQAVRFLTEQLGPMSDDVNLRIEKARAWQDLKPLLAMGVRILRDHRGPGTADAFKGRFLDPY